MRFAVITMYKFFLTTAPNKNPRGVLKIQCWGFFVLATMARINFKVVLPSEVSERFIRICHLVRIITLLHSVAFVLRSEQDLVFEAHGHWATTL